MPRFIIECEDVEDIILGLKAIKWLKREEEDSAILEFNDKSLWYVRETKTGYSARSR